MIPRAASHVQQGRIPIYLPGKDTPIGHVEGAIFRKSIAASRHMLHRPPAIAFDRCTLRAAQGAGATAVEVLDRESGNIYRAALAEVLDHAFPVHRGHGDQVALPLDRWSVNGCQPRAAQTYADNQARLEAQPSLFEVTA